MSSSSQLCTNSTATSRAFVPAAIRSESHPNPCQAASHSGPTLGGNHRGDGFRTSSPSSSISPEAIAKPRVGSPGQTWLEFELELPWHPLNQGVAIESGGGEPPQRVVTEARPQARCIGTQAASSRLIILNAPRDFHSPSPGPQNCAGRGARPGSLRSWPDEERAHIAS